MSDNPPTYLKVNVRYNNNLRRYEISISGPYVPETARTADSREEMLRLITSIEEYHSVYYDGKGTVKLDFWIRFCNKFDVRRELGDNCVEWFSSVGQFAEALPKLPHHPYDEADH
jgi:hypothetical protein